MFSADPLRGNPLAVVHDADGLSEARMAELARWTNLSETTYLLKPTDPKADYRVRIFTPGGELPFAGHPTLGDRAMPGWRRAGSRASLGSWCRSAEWGWCASSAASGWRSPRRRHRRSGPLEGDVLAKIAQGAEDSDFRTCASTSGWTTGRAGAR